MSANPDITPGNPAPCLALGADAGGSKLAIQFEDAAGMHERTWPSVNVRQENPETVATLLADRIRESLDGRIFSNDAVCCLGAAGAGTDLMASTLHKGLSEALGLRPDQVIVTSDARIAVEAAFGGESGILVIAGTGSGCYALDPGGDLVRCGGWGPGLEDPGSGSELGRAGIKHLLADLDAGNLDDLSRSVATRMGISSPRIATVLDAYYHTDFSPAHLAPYILDVMEAGSVEARVLVEEQALSLTRQCARLARQLGWETPSVAVVGGLTNRDSYVDVFKECLNEVLPGAPVMRSSQAPVAGALACARARQRQLADS